ncbi:MAG: glycosyltransferase family 4 protein [Candidatus Bathyarchaeia archaeon]|nr:glycosyltransferase family 4 protein [Candidatus Bathyarchaeota archaeon]
MRILWINHRCPKHPQAGGAENHILEVGRRLVQKGHEITLLTECFPGSKKNEVIDGIMVKRKGGKYGIHLYAPYFVKRYSAIYDIVIDDVAHAVPFFSYKFARKPVVALVHHVHQKVVEKELRMPLRQIVKWAERRLKNYERIIAVSNTTREMLINMLKVKPERIKVIYHGVDHEKFKPGDKFKVPTILWMGRIKKYKNLDHVIKAFSIVKHSIKDAKLIVVGSGDAKWLVNDMRIFDVTFMGHVSEEEKIRLLQGTWAIVYASDMEGWGMCVLEANACGTPTVAYNSGALKETVINGETGFLTEYGNIEGLAEKMKVILSDHGVRERLSRNALIHSQNFNWEKTTSETEEFLIEIAEE